MWWLVARIPPVAQALALPFGLVTGAIGVGLEYLLRGTPKEEERKPTWKAREEQEAMELEKKALKEGGIN